MKRFLMIAAVAAVVGPLMLPANADAGVLQRIRDFFRRGTVTRYEEPARNEQAQANQEGRRFSYEPGESPSFSYESGESRQRRSAGPNRSSIPYKKLHPGRGFGSY